MANTYTGNTTTLVFATSLIGSGQTADFSWISISGFDWSRGTINNSHLGTTYWEAYIPGDLWDAGEMSAEFIFDPDEIMDIVPSTVGANPFEASSAYDLADTEVLTLDFPGGANSPRLIGDAFITGLSMGGIANNERITGTVTWQWSNQSGSQGPYFTTTD